MDKKIEGTFATISALLVLFTAMLDPKICFKDLLEKKNIIFLVYFLNFLF